MKCPRPLPRLAASAALASLPLLLLPGLAWSDHPALLAAERARGVLTGDTGVEWVVDVKSEGAGGTRTAKFVSISQGGRIRAEVVEPAESEGSRYLAEADGKMWFWKPGLTRPVPISRRQRLSGDAAIGDIASTSFVDGYTVAGQEDGEVSGELATVFTMNANSPGDTYKQIRYWVTNNGNLGKKAEFYASSGNLLRSATMEYGNTAGGGPFLSRMVIQDSGRVITLRFSQVRLAQHPADLFDREKLGGGVTRARSPLRR